MSHAMTCSTVHLGPLPGHARRRRGSWRKLAGVPGRGARLTQVQPGRGGSRGLARTAPGGTS
jgi:hypothetical protein